MLFHLIMCIYTTIFCITN